MFREKVTHDTSAACYRSTPRQSSFERSQPKLELQNSRYVPRNRKMIKDTVLGDKAQPRLKAKKKRFPRWSTLNPFR
jgi:hypothetical protein